MTENTKSTPKKPSIEKTLEWYSNVRPQYEGLTKTVCSTLENLIKDKGIDYLSVTGRTKSLPSLSGKLKEKEYRNPLEEIHDFSGIRVTVYIESDVKRISELVKGSFHVHPDKSLDKTSELGVDRVGYRSVHFICELGDKRTSLPEYAPYKGFLFEVQIRTALQHAWAEMEHDRNYKLSGVLPGPLKRRFYVAAGTLEMVDRELDAIARAIDEYKGEVAQKADRGELEIGIDTTSLTEFMKKRFGKIKKVEKGHLGEDIISELQSFGIGTLAELESILSAEFMQAWEATNAHSTYLGLLRGAMMYCDIDRYFESSWNEHWQYFGKSGIDLLSTKYQKRKINNLLLKHSIKTMKN